MSDKTGEELYHVVTITAHQQAAIGYVLYNWTQLRILECLSALQKTDSVVNPSSLEKAGDYVLEAMTKYDVLTMNFPHFSDVIRGKFKLFYFNEENFNLIQKSLDLYDFETAKQVIGEQRARAINTQMRKLSDLFKESRQYKYTLPEINRFKNLY